MSDELLVAGCLVARPAESVPTAWSWTRAEDFTDPRCRAVFSASVAAWEAAGGVMVPEPTETYFAYMAQAVAAELHCSRDEGFAVLEYVEGDGPCFVRGHLGHEDACLRDHVRWLASEGRIRRLRSAIFAEAERAAGWVSEGMPPTRGLYDEEGSLLSDATHVGTGMVALGTALLDAVTLAGAAPRTAPPKDRVPDLHNPGSMDAGLRSRLR